MLDKSETEPPGDDEVGPAAVAKSPRKQLCACLSGVRLDIQEIDKAEREQQPENNVYPEESIVSPGYYIEDADHSREGITDKGPTHKRSACI
jgi:hypothetical protein